MPCTTILVGKKATYDGSTFMARNEDSGAGEFTPKKFITVSREDQPREYESVISKVKITLPGDPMAYTAMPNALPDEGIWGEAGINEANVSMTETETITSNPRVQGADPLVKGGIGEEDFLTIVLPYIRTAREGVLRLGALLEEFGTYEMNGIGFQDVSEIWWMETIGGHHWIAKRVPDDRYVVMPNQQGIDDFDFSDALGAQKNHLCSADMADFIRKNHLNLSMASDIPVEESEHFDVRAAFGSREDSDHVYNTPRAWFMLRYLNPSMQWDGPGAKYGPESDDLPWSLVPEKKITPEDVKYVLSAHFQGTPFDPYGKKNGPGAGADKGKYRPIGISRNNFVHLTQMRPYVPAELAGVEWISMGSNTFNAFAPFYGCVTKTPEYLSNTDAKVSTDSFYWSNRLIAAMADPYFNHCQIFIERYRNRVMNAGYKMLRETDEAFAGEERSPAEAAAFLEQANQKMADLLQKETDEVLAKVLQEVSCHMRNGFARSDA